MTVAPSMLAASSTVGAPSNRGTSPPAAARQSTGLTKSPARKPTAITREQPEDDRLERPLAAPRLDGEDADRDDADDQAAERQREPEQQVERDGAADDLGQVGGGGDQFGLHPERAPRAGAEPRAEQSGRLRPVTIPSFADWYCTKTAIALAATSTQTSR